MRHRATIQLTSGDEEIIKSTLKAPGRKRADAPQMPGFSQLTEKELIALSDYILQNGKK